MSIHARLISLDWLDSHICLEVDPSILCLRFFRLWGLQISLYLLTWFLWMVCSLCCYCFVKSWGDFCNNSASTTAIFHNTCSLQVYNKSHYCYDYPPLCLGQNIGLYPYHFTVKMIHSWSHLLLLQYWLHINALFKNATTMNIVQFLVLLI